MNGPDALRRGFDNVVANWPLILIRLAEGIVLLVITIAAVIAMVAPMFLAIGWQTLQTIDEPEKLVLVAEMILERWPMLLVGVVVMLLIALLMIMLHSFVIAGCSQLYVDGERSAGPHPAPRERFRTFTADGWLIAAKARWRAVFWIYNIIWGIWCLIINMPLLVALAFTWTFISRDQLQLAITSGCLGLAVIALVAVPTAIIANLWTQKAIVIAMDRPVTAREATRAASDELKGDLGAHLIVAVAVIIVAIAASGVFASFSAFRFGGSRGMMFALMPLQVIGSLLNAAVSAATDGWLLAAFAALTPKGSR